MSSVASDLPLISHASSTLLIPTIGTAPFWTSHTRATWHIFHSFCPASSFTLFMMFLSCSGNSWNVGCSLISFSLNNGASLYGRARNPLYNGAQGISHTQFRGNTCSFLSPPPDRAEGSDSARSWIWSTPWALLRATSAQTGSTTYYSRSGV